LAQVTVLAEQRDQPGQVASQRRLPAVAAEADPDAHVRLAIGARKQPAVPGVDTPRAGVEQDQQRQRDVRGQVRADRETPQGRLRAEHPGQPGDGAQRPVRGDDDLPRQALPVAGDDGLHPSVRACLDRGDPGSQRDRARLQGGLAQCVVEREPRHDDPVTGVGAPGEGRQPGAPTGRADREQVRALPGVGDAQPQIRQYLHPPRPHQVSARLIAREGRLVGERHPRAGPGQHQRGDAAGRPGTDHHRIETAAHRAAAIAAATRPATSGTCRSTPRQPIAVTAQLVIRAERSKALSTAILLPRIRPAIRKHFPAYEQACPPTASDTGRRAGRG
jgi:hypothetical protein